MTKIAHYLYIVTDMGYLKSVVSGHQCVLNICNVTKQAIECWSERHMISSHKHFKHISIQFWPLLKLSYLPYFSVHVTLWTYEMWLHVYNSVLNEMSKVKIQNRSRSNKDLYKIGYIKCPGGVSILCWLVTPAKCYLSYSGKRENL